MGQLPNPNKGPALHTGLDNWKTKRKININNYYSERGLSSLADQIEHQVSPALMLVLIRFLC